MVPFVFSLCQAINSIEQSFSFLAWKAYNVSVNMLWKRYWFLKVPDLCMLSALGCAVNWWWLLIKASLALASGYIKASSRRTPGQPCLLPESAGIQPPGTSFPPCWTQPAWDSHAYLCFLCLRKVTLVRGYPRCFILFLSSVVVIVKHGVPGLITRPPELKYVSLA
jgi:hypothetical protein